MSREVVNASGYAKLFTQNYPKRTVLPPSLTSYCYRKDKTGSPFSHKNSLPESCFALYPSLARRGLLFDRHHETTIERHFGALSLLEGRIATDPDAIKGLAIDHPGIDRCRAVFGAHLVAQPFGI